MIRMHFIRSRILELAAALFVTAAGMWGFYTWAPISTWFVYKAIEPVIPVKAGEPIFFRSRILGNYEVAVTWVDVLHCRHAGLNEFKQVHRLETEGRIRVQFPDTGPIWKYGVIPEVKSGDSCFLRSLITAHFPLGVDRQQVVNSVVFPVE